MDLIVDTALVSVAPDRISQLAAMTGGVLKMRGQPGTQSGYSGKKYNYVGRFSEKKIGKPFDALAQEMVFNPIGMRDTSYTA